jgi:signal transduction histidine kinase
LERLLRSSVDVVTDVALRHVGGGPKGLFLLLRYVFIASASYLLLFQPGHPAVAPAQAITIALALASNVALSFLPAHRLFSWWVSAPTLVADTVWVSWALHTLGGMGADFFLLYAIVLVLAAVGERPALVTFGAAIAGSATLFEFWSTGAWTTAVLLRVVFLFTMALFYGHVLARIRGERQRGDRSVELARVLEERVAERTAELTRLYEATRDANTAKTDFLSSMSHEVRTPLHIIIGYAEMLADGGARTPDEGARLGTHLRSAATGLLHLVNDILEMGRLEAGRVRIELQPVSVAAFAGELAAREWLAPHPGVTLCWDVRATDASMTTDPAKLQIVLSNLVTNALKYTREGRVTVTVEERPDGVVVFVVADTGPGIPAEQLAHIREPFHESSGVAGHEIGGVGLGLAIVHRYAALLGARVTVRSTVGMGTCFTVAVPCGAAARAPLAG